MASPLLKGRHARRANVSNFSSPSTTRAHRKPKIVFDDTRRVQADTDNDEDSESEAIGEAEEQDDEDDGSEDDELAPLLPIFESSHLDTLPVYNLTHAIRLLIVPRCETTLTWDQLRSPQVSQFMIKPIQKNIITSHFSRATLYALLSNCLQFSKEAADNPGNAGTSRTRAMACELLAIRLLKEYSIRELIDALSYDFYPLQGLHSGNLDIPNTPRPWDIPQLTRQQTRTARVSTLEIAIRAEAKRFLAHPVVVQQLEAIWAGTVVFHSAADSAHRPQPQTTLRQASSYGSIGQNKTDPTKAAVANVPLPLARKTVTIYDPRDASLFKLSRLRVPRYRSFLSTISLAILLGLFVAVLARKSIDITALEVLFWLWSAGFMLDEVVGLTDQGVNLYLLSFWNAFDLGILFILIIFYCLRLYGLIIADDSRKLVADLAYDVLGLNAILLFPRLFSVLDHYRYFSQLLIAFRIMTRDLVAVLVLIGISCSGFFVAFTFAFGNDDDGPYQVAYALFQLIMGFTPAAWNKFPGYNILGKAALVLFMFITHFLVVTILITVLTNSFMAIVQNANDEHQFLFAINTISMVKSDALFSYVAPTNILAWILTPLRACLPFRQYVHLNRTIIKITHFPILFGICAYERFVLKRSVYEPTDLIERRGRIRNDEEDGLFTSRTIRPRERSAATMFQDKALDAVFQRPLRRSASRLTRDTGGESARPDRVDTWISQMDDDGPIGPPVEQDRGIVDRLERRRLQQRSTPRRLGMRNFTTTMSVASDPENFIHTARLPDSALMPFGDSEWQDAGPQDIGRAGDEVDDHSIIIEGADTDLATPMPKLQYNVDSSSHRDYMHHLAPSEIRIHQPSTAGSQRSVDLSLAFEYDEENPDDVALPPSKPSTRTSTVPSTRSSSRAAMTKAKQREIHNRTLSTNTILYNPLENPSSGARKAVTVKSKETKSGILINTPPNELPENASPNHKKLAKQRRQIPNERSAFASTPNIGNLLVSDSPLDLRGKRSPYSFDIVSDLGDNKAPAGGYMAAMPASFGTHMEFMNRSAGHDNEEQRRMGKLMLARMNTLEQGFREVLKEVKDLRRGGSTTRDRDRDREREGGKAARALGKKRREGDWVEESMSTGTAASSSKAEDQATAKPEAPSDNNDATKQK